MSIEVRKITKDELLKHKSQESLWILIENNIYDVSRFLDEHPGGPEVLLLHAGTDATEPFNEAGHSSDARALLQDYKIGEFAEEKAGCRDWFPYLIPLGFMLSSVFIFYRLYSRSS